MIQSKKETEEERKANQFVYPTKLSYQENEKFAEILNDMGIKDVKKYIRHEGSNNYLTKEGKEKYYKWEFTLLLERDLAE